MKDGSPIRVGIVGAGIIAHVHGWTYEKLGAKVAWVYDPSPANIARFRTQFTFEAASSVEELADKNKIDVASVCSPPACHLENVLPLIAAGIPTLCEKPLAADVAGGEAIANAVRSGPEAPFMVGFCHRFDPRVAELGQIVHSGELGKPVLFRNAYARAHGDMRGTSNVDPKLAGGGALTGNGSHSIDLFRWLVGEPTRVQAMAATLVQNIAVEDVGLMNLSMNDRAYGEILNSFSLPFGPTSVEFYGTNGAAVVDYHDAPPVCRFRITGEEKWTTVDRFAHADMFGGEIAHFLECVKTGAAPSVSVDDGLRACQILAGAYRSIREGVSVDV